MTAQQFDTVDVLRLEVEADPDGLVNVVQNPNGELGGWGYLTPVANTAITGGAVLRFTTTAAQAAFYTTEPYDMAPGEWAAARIEVTGRSAGTVTIKARFAFLDAAGAVLSSSAQSAAAGIGVLNLAAVQAPAGTAKVELRVDMYVSGGNPTAGTWVEFKGVTVAIAAAAGDLGAIRTNLEPNPSLESAGTGWALYNEGGLAGGAGRSNVQGGYVGAFGFIAAAATAGVAAVGAQLAAIPVTAGKRYGIHAAVKAPTVPTLTPTRDVWIDFRWLDAGGAVLSTDSGMAGHETSGAYMPFTRYADAPPGAAQLVRIVKVKDGSGATLPNGETHAFDAALTEQTNLIAGYFDGSTADTASITYDWNGTANLSTSKATTSSLDYIEPIPFLNVLGSANSIRIHREALNLGTLEATIPDSALDPAQVDTIRPGRRTRLLVLDGAVWEPLFTGKILNGTAVYDPANPDPTKQVRVTMTAVDNTSALANQRRSGGVENIDELPFVLEGCGVPWNVNGSGDQVPAAVVLASNPNASAIDQVAITRDNHLGQAWIDRRNVVQAWDADQIPTTVQAVLDEDTYSGISIDYDTDRCINIVSIIFLRSSGEDTEEVTYGPYTDAASVQQWGEHEAEFRIQWADEDETAIAAYADAILTANSTPVVRINSVRLPIRTTADMSATVGARRALLDLMDLVTASNDAAGIAGDHRITTLEHNITGQLWTVDVGFVVDGSVALPQETPSPPTTPSWWPEMRMLFGPKASCPPNFLVMDGSAFSAADYPLLDAHLVSLGLPSGTLPNMTDVFPIGAGTKALGTSGGSPTKPVPPHTHDNTLSVDPTGTAAAPRGTGTANVAAQGHAHPMSGAVTGVKAGAAAFDVMNPWRAVFFIIRAR